MWLIFNLLLLIFIINTRSQSDSDSNNLPSVSINNNNLDDSIIQIFNRCKCVIFYLCDENNFIIPMSQVKNTQVGTNTLRNIRRITCSNKFYYCCKNRNDISTTTVQRPLFSYIPPTTTPFAQTSSFICGRVTRPFTEPIYEFPWMVAICEKRNSGSNCKFKCGGAVIHPKVVLTAQHCVRSNRENMLQITAETNTAQSNSKPVRTVSKIIRHSGYYSGGLYNDIALLILEEPFVHVTPICLPQSHQQFVGKRCTAVSWRPTDQRGQRGLQKIDLPIVGSETCQNLLRRTVLSVNFQLHSSALCAGGEEGKDVCQGGGGGSLICSDVDKYVQVGITSWGVQCGHRDVPGVYTDVTKLRNWIDEELGKENLSLVYSNS